MKLTLGQRIVERNGTQARPILRRDASKLFDASRRTHTGLGVTPIALLNNCDMDSSAHFRPVRALVSIGELQCQRVLARW